jgi:hypothetical protein
MGAITIDEARKMNRCQYDPTLEEILSDSIVAAVMAADGVDRLQLRAMLSEIAHKLGTIPGTGVAPSAGENTTIVRL